MAINERLIDTEAAAAAAAVDTDNNLMLHLDANDVDSYDGDGDEWIDIKDHEYKPTTNVAQHFNTITYIGDAQVREITQVGFAPDLVWIKERDDTTNHHIFDVLRGGNKMLSSNTTSGEGSALDFTLDSDGFSIDNAAYGDLNGLDDKYVAWCFKAGGAPSGSDTVSIDGTSYADEAAAGLTAGTKAVDGLSANNDLGFSIVKYGGNASAGTIGHGLDSAPELVIIKNLSPNFSWIVYSSPTGSGIKLNLNSTAGESNTSNFASTTPTSSVFSLSGGNEVNGSGSNYIAYCFASKRGVSKVGSFEGTGAAGNKIYTGFEPAFVMWKNADNSASNSQWFMFDNQRGESEYLMANSNSGLGTDASIQFHRDGFTVPSVGVTNSSGQTHIYYAVAKNTNETSLIPDTDLELHLDAASFDGSTNTPTTWTDSSSNSNDGTITGATFDSELGNYLDFDGSSDYVSASASASFKSATAFTVEHWINPDVVRTSDHFSSIYDQETFSHRKYLVRFSDTNGNLVSYTYDSGGNNNTTLTTTSAPISVGNWYHVVMTYDNGAGQAIYVNGEREAFSSFTNGAVNTGTQGAFYIGAINDHVGDYDFNGQIGQVRAYSTALSQAQIRQNYNFTKPSYPNGNDGTISGATFVPATGGEVDLFRFDGSDDSISLDNRTASNQQSGSGLNGFTGGDNTNYTISLYINTSDSGGHNTFGQPIIGYTNSDVYAALSVKDNKFTYSHYNGSWNHKKSSTSINDSAWHHCVFVHRSDATIDIYVDGNKEVDNVSAPMSAGRYFLAKTIGKGYIDEYIDMDFGMLKMYEKALTSSEVTAGYNATKSHYGL